MTRQEAEQDVRAETIRLAVTMFDRGQPCACSSISTCLMHGQIAAATEALDSLVDALARAERERDEARQALTRIAHVAPLDSEAHRIAWDAHKAALAGGPQT